MHHLITPTQILRGLLTAVLVFSLPSLVTEAAAKDHKKTKKDNKEKYEKLFRDKKVETAKGGLVTLHKVDGKLLMELPLEELNREMLLGATLSSTSDGSILTIGERSSEPLLMRFELRDSTILVKKSNTIVYAPEADEPLQRALSVSYRDPSIASYPVLAYTPDERAVVIDATSLMARESTLVKVIPKQSGDLTLTATPETSLSFIRSIKSYEDNAQVRVELNYKLSAAFLGMANVMVDMPTTVEATFTLLRLTDTPMLIRIADTRVGTFMTDRINFSTAKDRANRIFMAHRWRLEPEDPAAYARGELSRPVKPIILYLDPAFPEDWKEPIRQGVLAWNSSFEKIGFEQAIVIRDYPEDDSEFDPDNLKLLHPLHPQQG